MIICIEGITNSGKSTLCDMIEQRKNFVIANKYQKTSVVSQHLKAITGPCENLNKFDENTELLLYCALLSDKAHFVRSTHGNVVVDRFSLSVYSYFKARYGMDDAFLDKVIRFSSREIVPDVTIFLNVSLSTVLQRANQSPLSRKDIGIEKYFKELQSYYINQINLFTKKGYIIDCDNISSDELYQKTCEIMDWC